MSSDSAVVEADGGANNQDSSSALHVPSHQNLDESFEVTDQSLADTAIMGDHELPLIVDRSSTIAQFRKTGGPAVAIVPSESPLRPAAHDDQKQTGTQKADDDDAGLLPAAGSAAGEFDVCKEYGYKYEYTDEDGGGDDHAGGEDDKDESDPSDRADSSLIIDHDKDPLYDSSAHALGGGMLTTDDKFSRAKLDWSIASRGVADNNAAADSAAQFGGTSYLLGRSYHPVLDFASRRDDESSLLWMTYRRDFPIINPYGITSDAGWGCMLRSAQMMLCQALRVHYVGRDWRPPKSFVRRRDDAFVRNALTWFADYPSVSTHGMQPAVCRYSLHNMCAAGFKYEMLPGEWYGPQTACHVIKDLCEMHSQDVDQGNGGNNVKTTMFRVHVAQEASVYRDAINKLMTRDAREAQREKEAVVCEKEEDDDDNEEEPLAEPSTATSNAIEDPLLNNPLADAVLESRSSEPEFEWDAALLLLVPLRLGLKSFNADTYRLPLAHTFALRQSVGFLGGTPRHALWYYGASSDGSKIYGLDPHTVQDAAQKRQVGEEGEGGAYEIVLSDDYLRSVHCAYPSTMEMSRIDPSLALAFYCRDRADFDDLCAALSDMKDEGKKYKIPELFSVADVSPDYCANGSSALVDMMMASSLGNVDCSFDDSFDGGGGHGLADEGDVEDDFVLL